MDVEITKTVAVVLFKGDKVLLIKSGNGSGHPTGTYGLPAGRIDKGEEFEDTAKRECEEETGLIPKKMICLSITYEANLPRKEGGIKHFTCQPFYCSEYEGKLRSSNEGEPIWTNLNKLKDLPLILNVNKMIKDALMYRNNL